MRFVYENIQTIICALSTAKTEQTKTLITIPKFQFSLSLGLIWQLSTNQTKYNEGCLKLSYLLLASRITGFRMNELAPRLSYLFRPQIYRLSYLYRPQIYTECKDDLSFLYFWSNSNCVIGTNPQS